MAEAAEAASALTQLSRGDGNCSDGLMVAMVSSFHERGSRLGEEGLESGEGVRSSPTRPLTDGPTTS